jgi:hypothetical protein
MLGKHSKCIGLGEAYQLVDPKSNRIDASAGERCSCGERIINCHFWSKIVETIKNQPNLITEKKYGVILDRFEEVFGIERIAIDSSKIIQALSLLVRIPDINLAIIHLVRDVRAYTVSMHENYRRNRSYSFLSLIRDRGVKGVARFAMRSRFYSFLDWYWTQKNFDRFLKQKDIHVFRISYWELCIHTEKVLKELCEFLNLEFETDMIAPSSLDSHNVFGNRMRFQVQKQERIHYDHRWFYNSTWMVPSVVFPHIMTYNARKVYNEKWSAIWRK